MYHEAIHIIFWQRSSKTDPGKIDFAYDFLISKVGLVFDDITTEQQFIENLISYEEILSKFESLGFNTKFLNFPDIKDKSQLLWCNYNGNDYKVFFKAYEKVLKNQDFNITFEYGNVVERFNVAGTSAQEYIFAENNMNGPAVVEYHTYKSYNHEHFCNIEDVIDGKVFYKSQETYKIVDKSGSVIAEEITNYQSGFETHFFENKDVQLYLRKYKLQELKQSLFS